MFKTLKNTFTNFASYMLGLDVQLTNAKNDAERVKILTQIVEVQKKRIDELDEENTSLKKENTKLKDDGLIEMLIKANQEADKLGEIISQTEIRLK